MRVVTSLGEDGVDDVIGVAGVAEDASESLHHELEGFVEGLMGDVDGQVHSRRLQTTADREGGVVGEEALY